jgi:hypothetical protein
VQALICSVLVVYVLSPGRFLPDELLQTARCRLDCVLKSNGSVHDAFIRQTLLGSIRSFDVQACLGDVK